MPRDSGGTYSLPAGNPVVAGTPITASWGNTTLSDVGSELTNSIDKAGRTTPTANLPMGGFRLTGLGAGAANGESVRFEQVDLVGEASIASAATVSIFASPNQTILVTGTTGVTSFGANTAGQLRVVKAVSGFTLTYNAASMILPGAQNLVLAAGDNIIVKGLGASNAEVISVLRAAGLSTRLSDLAAAAGTNTLANGAFTQTWNWSGLNTNNSDAFKLTATATFGSGQSALRVEAAGSVARAATFVGPVYFGTQANFNADGVLSAVPVNTATAVDSTGFSLYGQNATSTSPIRNAGPSFIFGGNSTAGTGGDLTIGSGTGSPGGRLKLQNPSDRVSIYLDDSTPTISSGGGSGATIRGTDHFFEVTFGSGSPTSVVVGFDNALAAAPMALATGSQSGQVLHVTTSTTGVTISSSTAFNSGTKVSCMVIIAS